MIVMEDPEYQKIEREKKRSTRGKPSGGVGGKRLRSPAYPRFSLQSLKGFFVRFQYLFGRVERVDTETNLRML